MNYKEKLKEIDTLVFDVDGVFTDNSLYILEDVQPMRKMNVKDGYALQLAVKKGYRVAIISGGRSEAVRQRFQALGLEHINLGAQDKISVFHRFLEETGARPENILYMGDDVPDIPVMKQVGLPCCPQDATEAVKRISTYISPIKGGEGCVRDILEQLLKLNGQWLNKDAHTW